jgi:hypothetical protein
MPLVISKKSKLIEGLTQGSLEHLVQPLLSIDEYESKISNKRAIVVGFFVDDADPARDLSHYIDKSSYDILDTEVSPAPTPDGHYVVFVELLRDSKFVDNLMKLTDEITNVTLIDTWSFIAPSIDDPEEVNQDNLKKYIVLDPNAVHDEENDTEESNSIAEFWQDAMVDSIMLEGKKIILYKGSNSTILEMSSPVTKSAITMQDQKSRYLETLLGPAYTVWTIDNAMMIEHANGNKFVRIIG